MSNLISDLDIWQYYDEIRKYPTFANQLTSYQLEKVREHARRVQSRAVDSSANLLNSNPNYPYPLEYIGGREIEYWFERDSHYQDSEIVINTINRILYPAPKQEETLAQKTSKGEPVKKDYVYFKDIFTVEGWQKYVDALKLVNLLDEENNFIGKPKKHKGVICSWFKYLQDKGTVTRTANRQQLAKVLNNEIGNFNLGSDGKTFDTISNEFDDNFKSQLIEITAN